METAASQVSNTLVVEPTKMTVFTTIRYAVSCKDNLHSLERQVERLQSRMMAEMQKLKEAERGDQTAAFEFADWVKDVNKLEDDVKTIKAEFRGMTTPNIVARALLSRKAEELIVSTKELYDNITQIYGSTNIPQSSHNFDRARFVERQTCEPLGRDSVLLRQLRQLALDDTKSTIGIYGMGWVGKTELLKKFCNEFHQSNPDHRMIWVDMKDCRSVEDTQRAILRRLALRWNGNDRTRADRIFGNLKKNSFILILDDVRSAMDLKVVGIPFATEQATEQAKSKVILTTRDVCVCDSMEATKLQVKCLHSVLLQQLHQLALDDTKSTIGIHGMGGVGKTQLLNKFYNQFHQSNPDHRMIWVDMKDCHSVKDTQKAIKRSLAVHWNEYDKQETRAARISWYLKKKSFILILDDVWSAIDLKDVGIPLIAMEQAKSKVILATRREDVCDTMEATKIQVKCLDSDEAWSLFIEKAGEAGKELIESESEIRHQAEILVKKCGGLPLALTAIGHAMATKKTPRLWKHAVTTLESTPQKIKGMKEVLSCLKRSYDNLENDELRTCLSYCTMFPEDYDIYKENIVDYCMGEGVLVDHFNGGDHVYNEGYGLLDVLEYASMLQPSSVLNYVKMHPMIRILAMWIESGTPRTKYLIRAGKGLVEAPEVDDWSGVGRISLMHNNIEILPEMPNSPSLLILLLNDNPQLKICNGFFQSMTNLKVLDLSRTSIEVVPAEIGELVQLQYLDFSYTNITSLPDELGNLVQLGSFLLSTTPHLNSIPEGLIKRLSKLRVLYMDKSYEKWKVDSVGEGVDFEELHSLKRLKTLAITVNSAAAFRKLAESYRLASCTSKLEIKLCSGLKSTLSSTDLGSCFSSLKWLDLRECSDLEELSVDDCYDGLPTLPNLTNLVLFQLPRAKITWNGGRLQNLRYLTILECGKMSQLIHCDDESIEREDEEEEERLREINLLPNLFRLDLYYLPDLKSLGCGRRPLAFPSLERLDVVGCPKLKKLPLHAEKLDSIYGEVSWWNELEWPADRDDIKSKFQSLFKENERFRQNSHVGRPAADRFVTEGQDSVLDQLQQLAIDDRVTIIGVHGMAGVGKTRLLERFFYQFRHRGDYDEMIWIDMKDSHVADEAQKAVAEKLGVSGYQYISQEELARIIHEYLNEKNFILILDNVWRAVELDGVGIPTTTGQGKHKVILATRIEDACDSMGATKIHLKCLEWEKAYDLFGEKAGKESIESEHAITLVEKCGGLPLALVTVGRAMAKKRNPQKWEHAVKALENSPLQIQGMKDVLSCLKISYDNLADDKLRTCLLYCSMFGEGRDIGKKVLANYYIGEGVLADHFADGIELYKEGCNLLDVLKAASLLEDGEDSDFVKMHPMIRVLALWIAGDKLLVRASKGLTEAPDAAEWRGAERVSLMHNNIQTLTGEPDCPSLLTLVLRGNPLVEICQGFFKYMKNMRVLNLSYTSIQEVPAEIGELIELQYLNLSGTKISSLPRELANLIRLRFLGLQDTPSLAIIPQGLIASLTDLRALLMCESYKDWKVDSIGDGIDFEELHCLMLLKVLEISLNTIDALQKLAGSSRLANSTFELEMSLSEGLTTFSTASLGSEFKALKFLHLRQCGDLEELEIDVGDSVGSSTLPNLTDVRLIELSKAKIIWKSGCLQNLRVLTIYSCGGMRHLIDCNEESNEEEDRLEEINVLPNLYKLDLFDLPHLESLSCGSRPLSFPSLEVLDLAECPKLKKLPLNADKLRSIVGQLSWWNGLEWQEEHDNIKSRFKSIFVAKYS